MDSILTDTATATFTARLNLKVRPETLQGLDRIAATTGLTRSDVARVILGGHIERMTNGEV